MTSGSAAVPATSRKAEGFALLWQRFNELFDEERSLRSVALLRILVGPIVLIHLLPFLNDMLQGYYYADSFYAPWVSFLPEPSKPVYFVLLACCVPSALMLSLGWWTRASVGYTAFFVVYNFYLSETHFRHNRNFIVLVLVILSLLPCGRELSLDSWWTRKKLAPGTPEAAQGAAERGDDSNSRIGAVLSDPAKSDVRASLWPMYLLRFEVVSIYLASSSSKLVNPDWWDGTVNWDRVLWYKAQILRSGLPEPVVTLITTHGFHSVFAKVAIFTEMLIALGLLIPRTRYIAIWVAIVFHLTIGISLRVQIFSYLAIAALLIWVTPRVGERRVIVDLDDPYARRFSAWLRRLDWLGRFRIEAAVGPAVGEAIRLIDKDGSEYTGRLAVRLCLLRCPLLFPCLAPLLARHLPQSPRGSQPAMAHPS